MPDLIKRSETVKVRTSARSLGDDPSLDGARLDSGEAPARAEKKPPTSAWARAKLALPKGPKESRGSWKGRLAAFVAKERRATS